MDLKLTLRLLILVLAIVFGVAQWAIEHKYRDRRTRRYKWLRRVNFVLLFLSFAGSVALTVVDHYAEIQADLAAERAESKASKIAEELHEFRSESEMRDADNRQVISGLKDEVHSLNSRLDPFLHEATSRFPNLDPDEALQKLYEQLADRTTKLESDTRALANANLFVPIAPGPRQQVVTQLRAVRIAYPDFRPKIHADAGDTNRQRLANEMVQILTEGGFPMEKPSNGFTIGNTLTPLAVTFNTVDEQAVRALISAFGARFTRFYGRPRQDASAGVPTISFHGTPVFHEDGMVELR